MTDFPDFSALDFDATPHGAAPAVSGDTTTWETAEGIAVKPAYGPADTAQLDFLNGFPGIAPYLRGQTVIPAAG